MKVFINGDSSSVDDRFLIYLLKKNHLADQKGIAVAVNDQVIPRSNWDQHKLTENDKITVIKATQGG